MTNRSLPRNPGFTLLELLVVIVILGILLVLTAPAIEGIRNRVEKVRCVGNLRVLYAGASLYLQQHGSWPQINTNLLASDKQAYAKKWMDTLRPTGIDFKTWVCPTVQRMSGNQDPSDLSKLRIDYIPMPFDDKPMTPYKWPTQPWFVESNDVHGSGNLLVLTDGSVHDLNAFKKKNSGK